MKNGLKFFVRTSGIAPCFNVASFHSPHCACWSWILSFHFFHGDQARVWPLGGYWRDNQGLQWYFRVPFVGIFRWHRQRNVMPYRELYRALRDREDVKTYKTHVEAVRPPIADGGNALH